ncbi:hypothetical protein SCHPADRAFT_1000432 [Schizopora paradoxa]|uniref:Heterokaryon incompatibility domain-containing protein n=1 Tax=Schizopora paradoxa TaxID=27342 RepID=A0A0H2RI81_9AGAM|nr:hypothetical protein SCHPADRAFT_1000432 [Schizopora paradoxa]
MLRRFWKRKKGASEVPRGDTANWTRWSEQLRNPTRHLTYDDFLSSYVYREGATISTMFSSDAEAEREKLSVPLQKSFTGPSYVLSAEVASARLSGLGLEGILRQMNAILGTERKLSTGMHALLHFCNHSFVDFGQAYALLRPRWHMDPSEALENIEMRRKEDQDLRSRALEEDVVVDPNIPPRRLWDLWSNRVVPFWVVQVGPFDEPRFWLAVSHSWAEETHRHGVASPINGHEWPVPIPKDTSLDLIRIELLNLVASFLSEEKRWMNWVRRKTSPLAERNLVWLDVLCLRQEGVPSNEVLRRAEWKLDVPTIGPIYSQARGIVYYFNGLGRSFEVSPTDKVNPRHWLNRAWTLQETRATIIVAGQSPSSPNVPKSVFLWGADDRKEWDRTRDASDNKVVKTLMTTFTECSSFGIWEMLSSMRQRSATSELDKIAGLIFCFNEFNPPLPAYIVGENPEDAWDRLIRATDRYYRGFIFFLFPETGNGKYVWYPSWQQINDIDVLPTGDCSMEGGINFDEHSNVYSLACYYIEHCLVEGLSEHAVHMDPSSRIGNVVVPDKDGEAHTFAITANHKTYASDGYYDLVGISPKSDGISHETRWVIALKADEGFVKKVTVVKFIGFETNEAMSVLAEKFGESTIRLL